MRDLFLDAVLGPEGASALRKAAVREPTLDAVLVPRALLGWLSLAARSGGYEGSLPGIDEAQLRLQKSEDGFDGSIVYGEHDLAFSQAGLLKVASTVTVALGLDQGTAHSLLAKDMSNLGKAVDLLVKAKVVSDTVALRKSVLTPESGYTFKTFHKPDEPLPSTTVHAFAPNGEHVGYATLHHVKGALQPFGVYVDDEHQRKGVASHMYALAEKHTGLKIVPSKNQTKEGAALWAGNQKQQQFGKAELPGQPAAPVSPKSAVSPTPPQKAPARRAPKSGVQRSLMLTEKALNKKCGHCGGALVKAERFVGCLCWREMAQGTVLSKMEDGRFVLELGPRWDEEAVEAFVASLGAING